MRLGLRTFVRALAIAAALLSLADASQGDPCGSERRAYCNRLSWEAGLAPCLRRYAAAISDSTVFRDGCRQYVDRTFSRLPGACQQEAHALCGEVRPSYARLTDCLRSKRDLLSATCLAYFPRW